VELHQEWIYDNRTRSGDVLICFYRQHDGNYCTAMMHSISRQKLYITTPFTTFLPQATPTPTSDVTTSFQVSSDGKEQLTMKEVNTQGLKTYTFTLTNSDQNSSIPLFSRDIATTSSMTIPFNTFSPDNTYLFLERTDGGTKHYLVFQTSGEAFADGKKYIDATDAFSAYTSSYSHPEATGWGDNALLIVNAVGTDKTNASFWMEVPSENFIQLSSYFK